MALDRKKLALIHIIKRNLGLSDEEYRRVLRAEAGVSSARELDAAAFRKLMRHFVRSKHYVLPGGMTLRQKMFIEYLRDELGWDEGHLSNFVRKYYHRERLERLTKKEAMRLIESLKNVREHQGG
jgi:hypothetical protein